MSKKQFKHIFKDEEYLVIHKFFDDDPSNLDLKVLEELESNKFKGKDISPIDSKILKNLKKLKKATKKYDLFFVEPEWKDEPDKLKEKLKEMFPDDSSDKDNDSSDDELSGIKSGVDWADLSVEDDGTPEPPKHKPHVSVSPKLEQKQIRYSAEHKSWDDSIIFYSNKNFKRVSKKDETGKWKIVGDELFLNWKIWEPEVLKTNDSGLTFESPNYNFILKLKTIKEVPTWFQGKSDIKKPEPKKVDKSINNLKKPYTLETLSKEIYALTKKTTKSTEEQSKLAYLNKIKTLTEIQFKSLKPEIKNELQFNLISSFSTTEFTIADDMSKYILSKVDPDLKKDELSKLSITDATACIGGNTISFGKFFSNVNSIELEDFNYIILDHNVKLSKKIKDLYNPPVNGNIKVYLGSYEDVLPKIKSNDTIFFDPPWTSGSETYDKMNPVIPKLGDKTIFEVIDNVCNIYKHVFVKLPVNLFKSSHIKGIDIKQFEVKKYKKMILIYKKCKEDKPKEDKPKKVVKSSDPLKYKDIKFDLFNEDDKSVKKNDYKYILSQRKAYVDWINNDFYEKIMSDVETSMFKNYQLFVKGYLSLETPYRGLLVYHGLGTGKTATSIITTEGLSHMRINTLLPKSLKDNYVNEIKKFAGDSYDIEKNNWQFFTIDEINANESIKELIFNKIKLKKDIIKNTLSSSLRELKTVISNEVDGDETKIKILLKERKKELQKGLFLKINDVFVKEKEIFTYNGKLVDNDKISIHDKIIKLSDTQNIQLNSQLDEFILNKYNFIHSNALPTLSRSQLNDLDIKNDALADKILNPEENKKNSDRQDIMNNLIEKYKENKKKNILSPFDNEVIIIDEVHNLISQIKNQRGPSMIFYDWITESVDSKLIFLSGTPIINEPSEIAYLFNMLKGKLHVYDFVLKMTGDVEEITTKLKEIFYGKISCIEQLNVKKYKGKIIVSFIKTGTNFANILDEDDIVKTIKYNECSFSSFIKQIYIGLHKFIDKDLIIPSHKDFKSQKRADINNIINGKEKVYDTETNIIFNKNIKLFDIYDDDQTKLDLTDNGLFMDYFFDEEYNIPPKKQVLLRRMLMGLTSYYPIDRSAISYMPEIIEPTINIKIYDDYSITKKINLVPCYMSFEQYSQYETKYNKEQEDELRRFTRRSIYEDEFFHYYSGTRQTCNIIYNEPNTDDETKIRLMNEDNNFSDNLKIYSPKILKIIENMEKFTRGGNISGKVLLYSVYKGLGGSGGFEEVLKADGYEKYDYKSANINKLVENTNKKKRYTFITGDEDEIEKGENKSAYNHDENIHGEYIQVMIISQSGAEGISLTCVRQVHILEPFWNNVRVDQVFGRAIRRNSHIGPDPAHPWLPVSDQNVEEYLYLSMFPEGENLEQIFSSIKELEWDITKDIELQDNFNQYLLDNHKNVYTLIQKIINIKSTSRSGTTDQMLFDIMERKYNINDKLNNIIKESSVDCIKHTTDDPILNSKCIQFSEKLQNEIAYFPGIGDNELNQIDNIQLKSVFSYFIKSDSNVVVSSQSKTNDNIYSYYKINAKYKDEDVRYIKENGTILCDAYINENKFLKYENEKFFLNNKITNKFSVIQSIYHVPFEDPIYDEYIYKEKFPSLELITEQYLVGYKIKYNINDKLFFMPINNHDRDIYKLYDYEKYLENGYSFDGEQFLVIYDNKFYESI